MSLASIRPSLATFQEAFADVWRPPPGRVIPPGITLALLAERSWGITVVAPLVLTPGHTGTRACHYLNLIGFMTPQGVMELLLPWDEPVT